MVTVMEEGAEREITAQDAFLMNLIKRGMEGNRSTTTARARAVIQSRREQRSPNEPSRITVVYVTPGSVTQALEALRMAKKLDRHGPSARLALEPWLVEAALSRLGEMHLSPEEQKTVLKAMRTPQKVKWPEWWTIFP